MFTPQYFPQPQQIVQGYVQPLQVYHTPEQGVKRDHSPLSTITGDIDGKRVRILSGEPTLTITGSNEGTVRELTLLDVMTELKNLATKDDIAQIKSSLVAQSAEIEQLRSEMGKHHDRIKSLEEQASAAAVEATSRTRPEVNSVKDKQYGGARVGVSGEFQVRRRSVIIHGLNRVKEDELMETVLDLCQALKVIVFATDVDDIARLGRIDPGQKREVPVRVTFQLTYMRDNVLRKKKDLALLPRFADLYINPDEPHEIRRNKGFFRRVAAKARADGKEVTYRGEWIKIEDVTYSASEVSKIPKEYQPEPSIRRTDRPGLTTQSQAGAKDDDPATTGLIYGPNVNIKLTKAGLTFSGPTAFVSNMSPCDFTYHDQPYTSTEQGIQHLNAVHHQVPEIAKKILEMTDAVRIKKLSHDIPKSETWPKIAPGKLLELNEAKYDQNPPLLKKLVDTAPHKLVEASIDSFWGGGAPFGAEVYEQGIIPGKNTFGDMSTSFRDRKIAKMELNSGFV